MGSWGYLLSNLLKILNTVLLMSASYLKPLSVFTVSWVTCGCVGGVVISWTGVGCGCRSTFPYPVEVVRLVVLPLTQVRGLKVTGDRGWARRGSRGKGSLT